MLDCSLLHHFMPLEHFSLTISITPSPVFMISLVEYRTVGWQHWEGLEVDNTDSAIRLFVESQKNTVRFSKPSDTIKHHAGGQRPTATRSTPTPFYLLPSCINPMLRDEFILQGKTWGWARQVRRQKKKWNVMSKEIYVMLQNHSRGLAIRPQCGRRWSYVASRLHTKKLQTANEKLWSPHPTEETRF